MKPWIADVSCGRHCYFVGDFDTPEEAKAAAEREAFRYEDVRSLNVRGPNDAQLRVYWRGRKPIGEWYSRRAALC